MISPMSLKRCVSVSVVELARGGSTNKGLPVYFKEYLVFYNLKHFKKLKKVISTSEEAG